MFGDKDNDNTKDDVGGDYVAARNVQGIFSSNNGKCWHISQNSSFHESLDLKGKKGRFETLEK